MTFTCFTSGSFNISAKQISSKAEYQFNINMMSIIYQ